jgi:hypothetical protein
MGCTLLLEYKMASGTSCRYSESYHDCDDDDDDKDGDDDVDNSNNNNNNNLQV